MNRLYISLTVRKSCSRRVLLLILCLMLEMSRWYSMLGMGSRLTGLHWARRDELMLVESTSLKMVDMTIYSAIDGSTRSDRTWSRRSGRNIRRARIISRVSNSKRLLLVVVLEIQRMWLMRELLWMLLLARIVLSNLLALHLLYLLYAHLASREAMGRSRLLLWRWLLHL